MATFFPFAEYWWFYLAFTGFVLLMLVVDLGLFHRDAHEVRFKEAAAWSVAWVVLALAFSGLFYLYSLWTLPLKSELLAGLGMTPELAAKQLTLEFLTGYVVEKALAVDNIFIFVLVFSYFGIPAKYQHRVLFFGILGALLFRGAFIAAGSVLMQYHWVVVLFGLFLILTGVKMLLAPEKPMDPGKNPVIRLVKKLIPVTPSLHGQKFFVKESVGKGMRITATPLFLALVFLELADVVFAVDSVPAIFALTKEPLIVFTSNIFAILGLRAMYFLLAGATERFKYIKYGLALVLVFVGLKMSWLNSVFDGKFPILWSLGIIGALIGGSVLASIILTRKPASALLSNDAAPAPRLSNNAAPAPRLSKKES